MNIIKYSLLLVFFCLFSETIVSQGTFKELDKAYGLDPAVFNGRKYSYFLPSGTGGHQYLYSMEFVAGGMEIRGKGEEVKRGKGEEYLLNYDIYNQKVLLKFEDESQAVQIIEFPQDWLNSFSLGEVQFKIIQYEGQERVFQALGHGKYQILFYWRKDLNLSNSTGYATYSFSSPIKTKYVWTGDHIRQFNSRGSFIKIFDPAFKTVINKYMKDKKINLKQASDQDLSDFIDFISTLD